MTVGGLEDGLGMMPTLLTILRSGSRLVGKSYRLSEAASVGETCYSVSLPTDG